MEELQTMVEKVIKELIEKNDTIMDYFADNVKLTFENKKLENKINKIREYIEENDKEGENAHNIIIQNYINKNIVLDILNKDIA